MNKRPLSFPQSKAILREAAKPDAAHPSPDFPVIIKRGRGARVITIDGNMLHDFWLADGRYPLGHAPGFLTQAQKNAVSLGGLAAYLRNDHIRLLRRLAQRLPGYTLYFARLDFSAEGTGAQNAEILDLRKNAFTTSKDLLPQGARPDIALINGALWLDIIAVRDGFPVSAAEELPDAPSCAYANTLLRKLDSIGEPYSKIAEHAALFKSHAASLLVDDAFFPRITMNEEKRIALLHEGFLLSPDGVIYFCAEHDPRAVTRLANALMDMR
ncbi:MAG: hypothetical protein LBC99_04160 [Spirochaetota bacterium]|jgi:hypothetical protein|nr:hypothetical protein [Spirochaetota bacterium]